MATSWRAGFKYMSTWVIAHIQTTPSCYKNATCITNVHAPSCYLQSIGVQKVLVWESLLFLACTYRVTEPWCPYSTNHTQGEEVTFQQGAGFPSDLCPEHIINPADCMLLLLRNIHMHFNHLGFIFFYDALVNCILLHL